MADDAKEKVRRFFARHAASYTHSESHRSGPDLVRLLELLHPGPPRRCLDVGSGPGPTALALATRGHRVVALDLAVEMGREFLASAASEGVSGARYTVGDSESLPFAAAAFDVVTCRRAAHHFPDPATAVREFGRVLGPGGAFALSDMTTADDPAAAELANAMEKARDSSHARALPPGEWREIVSGAGFRVAAVETLLDRVPWPTWLNPLSLGGEEDDQARSLVAEADPTVARIVWEDGSDGGFYLKRRVVLVAHRS